MYAIWLTFAKDDREYLRKIINEISKKYNAPKFEPHITVYGLIDSKISHIEKIIKEISNNYNSFVVKKSEILQSENLWKTVYIELKTNNELDLIHKNLKNHFENISKYEFNPHISLIYKILSIKEKTKIVDKLNIKNEFTVDKLCIQKFFRDIEKWKIVREYNLN